MIVRDALIGITRLGLDTAPIIYFVEASPQYHAHCSPFFDQIDNQAIEAFTSVILLTETLVHPLRNSDVYRLSAFRSLLLATQGISTVSLTITVAERAAQLRAVYNLRTPDTIQVATALAIGCDAFLTNDINLKRVTELRVIVVGELSL